MTFSLYDSARQTKVVIPPSTTLGLYVCGPTVYNYLHIGNCRPLVVFDVLFRFLNQQDYIVNYVRNITDVDDKILQAAQEKNLSISQLTTYFSQAFHENCQALNCLPPTYEPRATEHIAEMIEDIGQLIDKELAYIVDGNVYFSINKLSSYGSLCNLSTDELLAGVRKDLDPRKKAPGDFALWKSADKAEVGWLAPWGYGRPGWHIECTTMAIKYLGKSFAIHGGGVDLRFPHHENEQAQAHGLNGTQTFAQHWMHNGHVGFMWTYQGKILAEGLKVAKSSPDYQLLRELFLADSCIKRHGGEAVRLFLLGTHYRSPLLFEVEAQPNHLQSATMPGLAEAEKNLVYAYTTMQRLLSMSLEDGPNPENPPPPWFIQAQLALFDDLNTPVAIAQWYAGLNQANRLLDQKAEAHELRSIKFYLARVSVWLGVLQDSPDIWLAQQQERQLKLRGIDRLQIETLIAQRNQARSVKDYSLSDNIRQHLLSLGVEIMDGKNQPTTWRLI